MCIRLMIRESIAKIISEWTCGRDLSDKWKTNSTDTRNINQPIDPSHSYASGSPRVRARRWSPPDEEAPPLYRRCISLPKEERLTEFARRTRRSCAPVNVASTMSKYNVNEEYGLENRREVTLTGFSSNMLDDVLRGNGNNNELALNGNPGGIISGAHAITKDAKIVNLEGESVHYLALSHILTLHSCISYFCIIKPFYFHPSLPRRYGWSCVGNIREILFRGDYRHNRTFSREEKSL